MNQVGEAMAARAAVGYRSCGVRKRRTVMKFASFENVLMLATLTMFAVFLAWSVKIIAAWA